MKRRHLTIGAAAIAAMLFAAPLAAGADPVISTTGVAANTATAGGSIVVDGSQCSFDGPASYVGIFFSNDGTTWSPLDEQATNPDGSWQWQFDLPADSAGLTIDAVIYCATGPATSLDDPAIQWESSIYTTTMQGSSSPDMAPAGRSAARVATIVAPKAAIAKDATADPTAAAPELTLNINSLPRIDKMGLPAAQADALKAKVDSTFSNVSQVVRLYKAFLGTYGDQAGLQSYVNMLNAGQQPIDVANAFNRTTAVKSELVPLSYQAEIDRIYTNLFGHPADAATNASWTAQLRGGLKVANMVLAIANTSQATTDNSAYVIATELALGKPVTGVAATDAIAAPLNAQQQTKVAIVESIALS